MVLRGVDSVMAVFSYVVAALLVLMLFVGPQVIAEDKPERSIESAGSAAYGSGAGADGAAVFQANCGSCHVLSAAGTSGQSGPNLDDSSASVEDIEAIVRAGEGSMPPFEGQLSDAEIEAVAAFVDATR